MEVFLRQNEGLSVGIYTHIRPMRIPQPAGLRHVGSPGAVLVPCPAQLRGPGTRVPTAALQLLHTFTRQPLGLVDLLLGQSSLKLAGDTH